MISTLKHTSASKRDSNIELLRLVLLFFIVVHHGFTPGLELGDMLHGSFPIIQDTDLLPACLINAFCIIGVNTFILISGYYGIKTTKSKFLNLLCQMFVYVLLFSVPVYLIQGSIGKSLSSFLLFSHSRYWFVIDYLILMALAPGINLFFDKTCLREQGLFTMALLLVSCYLGFLWHFEANVNGYTVFQFITLYSTGRYLKNRSAHLDKIPALVIYVLCSFIITALMMFFHKTGHDSWAWIMTYYNNPILIASAIAFFFIFKNMKIEDPRINQLSASSLAIYLFSCSALMAEIIYYPLIQSSYEANGRIAFLLIPVIAFLVSTLSIIVDKLLVSRIVSLLHLRLMSISKS